jgi:glycosyltransferase involved in cell wall biosynthesis
MSEKLTIYILGDYKSGAADGLTEFSYQNVQLLREDFNFNFIEFDYHQDKNYYILEDRGGIVVHRFGKKGFSPFRLTSIFKSWLAGLPKTNILFHLSHIYNITNYSVAKLLHKEEIPYLLTPHDSYVYCSDYQKQLYRQVFVRIFDKYVLDHASLVHGLTQQCTPCIRILSDSPIMTVGNQVQDLELKFDASRIKPQICYIGRFEIYQKGIDRAIKAFKIFKDQDKNSRPVNFTLIGPASAEALRERDQLVEDLRLSMGEEIVFTGKVTVEEKNNILNDSKVYMQMSRSEGFGLSIIEALSSYKPVIISKQVPINDRILQHKAGYVVNDPQEAADALSALFALSDEEYIQMAYNARHCYETEFHPDVIRPQLRNLYLEASKLNFS